MLKGKRLEVKKALSRQEMDNIKRTKEMKFGNYLSNILLVVKYLRGKVSNLYKYFVGGSGGGRGDFRSGPDNYGGSPGK